MPDIQRPRDWIIRRETEDRLSRLDTPGPAFSTAIDLFQVVAGTAGKGAQVSFRFMRARGLDSVAVIRNLSLDTGSADLMHVFPAKSMRTACLLTFSDQDVRLTTAKFYYWLKLIPLNAALDLVFLGPVSIGPTPV